MRQISRRRGQASARVRSGRVCSGLAWSLALSAVIVGPGAVMAQVTGRPTTAAERELQERVVREQEAVLAQQRQAELQQLSEKLRKAREQRAGQSGSSQTGSGAPTGGVEPSPHGKWTAEVRATPPPAASAQRPIDPHLRSGLGFGSLGGTGREVGRATVLIVMQPGARGIRRFDPVADPVLCMDDGCYISSGPAISAQLRSHRGVLGVSNTWAHRAGACRASLTCVFRDVEIGPGSAMIAPIDLRFVRHDRRERTVVTIDHTCRVAGRGLSCGRPYEALGYRVWIVPEAVAQAAGAELLQRAVDDGLRR